MYNISYKYKDGRNGLCIEDGEPVAYEDAEQAQAVANELNAMISPELRPFFPFYYVTADVAEDCRKVVEDILTDPIWG